MSDKKAIATDKAPAAIGPYSQAIRVGNMLFCSGQIALDPDSQQMVEGGIEAQTRRALDNLKAVVEAAGLTLDNVVKTTVFLDDFADYPKVNAIYGEYFTGVAPARAAVAVSTLPKNALVEIEAIAVA
ncbi:MAG: RidA family protein [Myxococcota bacterium]